MSHRPSRPAQSSIDSCRAQSTAKPAGAGPVPGRPGHERNPSVPAEVDTVI